MIIELSMHSTIEVHNINGGDEIARQETIMKEEEQNLDLDYLKTLTVLFVEDDTDTREQFSEFLRRPVGRLITAVNGAEGLDAFVRHAPDIVVTDIRMPIMDGLTMASKIRELDHNVQIIVITAFESNNYLKQAIDIRVDKFVNKPVNIYQLLICLSECARRLRSRGHHIDERVVTQKKSVLSQSITASGVVTGPVVADDGALASTHETLLDSYGGSETVLIVGDSDAVMMMHGGSLESYGYPILIAKDGLDALTLYAAYRETIRILFIDVILPDMKGCEVVREIRRQRPDMPVIMSGGYTNDIVEQMAIYELGVVFLRKPVKLFELLAAIRSYLHTIE